jgi:hypothetical protein
MRRHRNEVPYHVFDSLLVVRHGKIVAEAYYAPLRSGDSARGVVSYQVSYRYFEKVPTRKDGLRGLEFHPELPQPVPPPLVSCEESFRSGRKLAARSGPCPALGPLRRSPAPAPRDS